MLRLSSESLPECALCLGFCCTKRLHASDVPVDVLQNGQQRMIQNIYIRGSKIRFVIVPDMMKNAPMFKRVDPKYKDKLPKMGESGFARKNHVRRSDKKN